MAEERVGSAVGHRAMTAIIYSGGVTGSRVASTTTKPAVIRIKVAAELTNKERTMNDKILPVIHESERSELAAPADVGTALINLVNRIGPDSTTAMVEALEKMCELQIKMDAITAQKNFAAAKARMQAELTSVPALGEMKEGGTVLYKHPKLDQIAQVVKPICERHGFSYSFEYDVKSVGERMMATTTFVLLHQDGHSERANFVCEMCEGNKLMREGYQKSGATQTASMRRAMIGGLGLTWCDPDTDGVVSEDVEKINEDELATLTALLQNVSPDQKVRSAIQARFMQWIKSRFGAARIEEIPKSAIDEVIAELEEKKKRHGAK
jgi:hypothetical protein